MRMKKVGSGRMSEGWQRPDHSGWPLPGLFRDAKKMTDEELEAKFLEYYRSGGGRQNLNQIHRDRIIRDKKRFREIISYLLDEKINVAKRMDEILDGKSHIEGVGKAIATSFLIDFNPNRYRFWNNKTEMGFSILGWKVHENKDSWGEAYLKVLGAIDKLRSLKPEYSLSFDDVDLFLHTISAEKEGEEAVNALTEGREILKIPVEPRAPTPREIDRMEFAMEKYLEEFI